MNCFFEDQNYPAPSKRSFLLAEKSNYNSPALPVSKSAEMLNSVFSEYDLPVAALNTSGCPPLAIAHAPSDVCPPEVICKFSVHFLLDTTHLVAAERRGRLQ